MPLALAAAVCEWMQYSQLFVTLTAIYSISLVSGSIAPGAITCFTLDQMRWRVAGELARTFQKLLIQSDLRVALISSNTACTSFGAAPSSTIFTIAIYSSL